MGCKSSKVAVVADTNDTWVDSVDVNKKPSSGKPRSGKKAKGNVFLVQECKSGETLRSGSDSSLDDLPEGPTRAVGSATSKISSRTCDSGLGEDYSHVITEGSDPQKQKLAGDRPDTPDFMLSGQQIQVRQRSAKKNRDTASILEELQQQGLLSSVPERPQSRAVAFEVMLSGDEGLAPIRRAPPRLARLKKRHKKKKHLTKEQLEEKLKAAEERRKAKEQEMKEKLQAQLNKDKQVHDALATFEKSQKAAEEAIIDKVDRAAEKREAQALALKEKMQKKKEHAERVRQLKLQRQAEAAARGDNNEQANEHLEGFQVDPTIPV
ncbi:uncharacterized protein LOC100373799 [Saccoglossus kowalevskii]|uniref:Caldesmon-like n=1 Tax=Saccoglossus kowalevskii TaxID=10224 RepID=A0ABM0GK50_SACKO|nr:PREDICTED: caldesmon-like [Saccoglossus kowalevskii]